MQARVSPTPEIEGFASQTSVNLSGLINFYVDVRNTNTDPQFAIQIYRLGWYGGLGGRQMTWLHEGFPTQTLLTNSVKQPIPNMSADSLVDCLQPCLDPVTGQPNPILFW